MALMIATKMWLSLGCRHAEVVRHITRRARESKANSRSLHAAHTHLNHHAVIGSSARACCVNVRCMPWCVWVQQRERVCVCAVGAWAVNCYVLAGVGAYEVTLYIILSLSQ
jgi:hypothetical protein